MLLLLLLFYNYYCYALIFLIRLCVVKPCINRVTVPSLNRAHFSHTCCAITPTTPDFLKYLVLLFCVHGWLGSRPFLSFPSKIFRKTGSSAHSVKYNALLYAYMTTYHCFNCKNPINEGDPCVYFVQGKLRDCAFVRIPYSLSGIICANCASKTIF